MVRHQTGTWRYRVEINATVTLTGDSTAPSAPIRSIAIYALAIDTAAGGFRVTGRIDSTALSAGGRVPPRPVDTLKVAFSAELDTVTGLSGLSPEDGQQPPCAGGIDPSVAGVAGVFFTLPRRLRPGATWQDSTTTVTCRGTVAVTSTLYRTYTVVDTASWNGHAALRVDVSTTSTLAGTGVASAAGDSISVRGTGTSSGTILFDLATAMPFSTAMTGRSSVTVDSRQNTLPFDQQMTETVTLLDHKSTQP